MQHTPEDHLHPVSNSNQNPDSQSTQMFKGWTYNILAPEGDMTIVIMENDKKEPIGIHALCGKSGYAIGAWLDFTCRLISRQLESKKLTIQDLLEELSSTRAQDGKVNHTTGVSVSSGPEAIFVVLLRYMKEKYEDMEKEINPSGKRFASMGRIDD